jgi:hypothetical protein
MFILKTIHNKHKQHSQPTFLSNKMCELVVVATYVELTVMYIGEYISN